MKKFIKNLKTFDDMNPPFSSQGVAVQVYQKKMLTWHKSNMWPVVCVDKTTGEVDRGGGCIVQEPTRYQF